MSIASAARRRVAGSILATFAALVPCGAQTPVDDGDPVLRESSSDRLVRALHRWAEAYDRQEINPGGHVRFSEGNHPVYGRQAGTGGALQLYPDESIEHLDAVKYLIFAAEKDESPAVHKAILRVAAVGLDRPLSDQSARAVRDTAMFALLRSKDERVWPLLIRAANGVEEFADFARRAAPVHGEMRDEDYPVHPAIQVAALRVLSRKNAKAFRGTVEGRLLDPDPRVRLAAANALARMRNRQALPRTARAAATERHPVVAEALLRAIDRTLESNIEKLHPDRITSTTSTVLRAVGKVGWRCDLSIIRLAERFPCRDSVPALIRIMRQADTEDALTQAVNDRALTFLRDRALVGLKRITGAIKPADTADSWEKFWIAERGNFDFSERPKLRQKPQTSSAFFGIPIIGEELAFIVDTSGSMSKSCEFDDGQTRTRRKDLPSRLEVAKAQILKAVHAMDPSSRYHLITFDGDVHEWSKHPVQPNPRSYEALTEVLARIGSGGGTNISGALELTIDPSDRKFGEGAANHIDEIFVLTDGEPSAGILDTDGILEMVKSLNPDKDIRIHTVFAGNRDDPGADLLEQLAERNGGVFVRVN